MTSPNIHIVGDDNIVAFGEAKVDIFQIRWVPPKQPSPEELAAAEQKFAQIPLDQVPDPVGLPAATRLLHRNPKFTGREHELKSLARLCKELSPVRGSSVLAVTGISGVGKSQVANEFAQRYGAYFAGGVFWLNFAMPDSVPAEVVACSSEALGLRPDFGELSLAEQVNLVISTWQSPLPRLLIFDNCEEPELLERWLPPTGNSRILITSQRAVWEPTLVEHMLHLGAFGREESLSLLHHLLDGVTADDRDLDKIAEELGDLPLAVHLAGSYLLDNRYDVSPATYLEELRESSPLSHTSLQPSDRRSPTLHELSVKRSFDISYRRLRPSDDTDLRATDLLARAACFAPGEFIPRDLLLATTSATPVETPNLRPQVLPLQRLVTLGLLEEGREGALRIHRLLAEFVREEANYPEAQRAVEIALMKRARETPLASLLALHHHFEAVTDAAMDRNDFEAFELCSFLGDLLHSNGQFEESLRYYARACEMSLDVLGSDDVITAESLHRLGLGLRDAGEYGPAQETLEEALQSYESTVGPDAPETAASHNSLGSLYLSLGDIAAARKEFEQAKGIRERMPEPDKEALAISLGNLGLLALDEQNPVEAQKYFERALDMFERLDNPDGTTIATCLLNLGLALRHQRRTADAWANYERALQMFESALGADHPGTATCLNLMGNVLLSEGDLAGARSYFERALTIWERVGPNHPTTAQMADNLALVLQSQGEFGAARTYIEQALAVHQRVFGADHRSTATSLLNLGNVLHRTGEFVEARSNYEKALAIFEKVLGPNHLTTAGVLSNLAALTEAEGELVSASKYADRALEIREAVLGEDDPETQKSVDMVAHLLVQSGEFMRAAPYIQRVVAAKARAAKKEGERSAD